jgi:hypothetical protein
VNPDIPAPVSNAVYRAMSKKPAERFPDIAAFVAGLGGKAAPQIPLAFTGPTPAARRPRVIAGDPTERIERPTSRRAVVVGAIVAGVALIGGGLWVALRPSKSDNTGTLSAGATITPVDTPAPQRSAPPETRPAGPAVARARLSISTRPVGTFFLDARRGSSTPILNLEITAGRHRVQVKQDGYQSFDTVFTARPGQEIKWTRIVLKPIGG